ncbi:hypothetical protein E2C01_037137 [Portunus trituberculatus]|uniref:Uncharacterized protein n=1 Tax=Portunus trituberculatus TaxID=210409 RepID=A0A5B7FE59_PORTR|nr:hypothetical protein [Portunus trituberculatus]
MRYSDIRRRASHRPFQPAYLVCFPSVVNAHRDGGQESELRRGIGKGRGRQSASTSFPLPTFPSRPR